MPRLVRRRGKRHHPQVNGCARKRGWRLLAAAVALLKTREDPLSLGYTLTIQVRENFEALEDEMNQPPAPSPESSEE